MRNTPRLACFPVTPSRAMRRLSHGLSVLALAGLALGLGGCGGSSSERPNFSQALGYTGTYLASVNRSTSGTAVDATLPSGTVSLTASAGGSLTASLSLTDTTRAAASRSVLTYGDITGTYDSSGTFDLSGRPREYNNQNGSYSLGQQTARLQGRLSSSTSGTTFTAQIGGKTVTGTLTLVSAGTPTPSPSPSVSNAIPAPPSF